MAILFIFVFNLFKTTIHYLVKNTFKDIVALTGGIFFSVCILEVFLRLYNPFPSRVKGDKIILRTNYSKKVVISPRICGLDSAITFTLNSMGMRGSEPPNDFTGAFTIIAVGGSTTACSTLDDTMCWPFLLGKKLEKFYPDVWVNNAGMDGLSSYAHKILLDDYLSGLNPDMILFLVGANDRAKASFEDENGFLQSHPSHKVSLLRRILKKCEIALLIENLYRSYQAYAMDISYSVISRDSVIVSEEFKKDEMNKNKKYIDAYRQRLFYLVNQCRKNNITPVLITQPVIYYDNYNQDVMELYNDVVRAIGFENGVYVIDLSMGLPKSVHYIYDHMHFTNEGADKVADIISGALVKMIEEVKKKQISHMDINSK